MLIYCFLSKPFDNVNSEVQQLFAIFTAVSHRSGSLEAQLNGVKRSSLCTNWWISIHFDNLVPTFN